MRSGTIVLGVDLAGVPTRPTGICVLWGRRAETVLACEDAEIVDRAIEVRPKIVAVDAPLSLPPGRRSIEDRTEAHLRACDRALLERGIRFFPITLGPMRKLTERGIHLKRLLKAAGFCVIEVYPGGAQDVWNIPRKGGGVERLRAGLERMGVIGLTEQMSDHELDAVTAAMVGAAFLKGEAELLGAPEIGVIVMPKPINSDIQNR